MALLFSHQNSRKNSISSNDSLQEKHQVGCCGQSENRNYLLPSLLLGIVNLT